MKVRLWSVCVYLTGLDDLKKTRLVLLPIKSWWRLPIDLLHLKPVPRPAEKVLFRMLTKGLQQEVLQFE